MEEKVCQRLSVGLFGRCCPNRHGSDSFLRASIHLFQSKKACVYTELVPPWESLALMSDITNVGKELDLFFNWTPREGNEAAHWIASASTSSLVCNWVSNPPFFLSILCKDASVS